MPSGRGWDRYLGRYMDMDMDISSRFTTMGIQLKLALRLVSKPWSQLYQVTRKEPHGLPTWMEPSRSNPPTKPLSHRSSGPKTRPAKANSNQKSKWTYISSQNWGRLRCIRRILLELNLQRVRSGLNLAIRPMRKVSELNGKESKYQFGPETFRSTSVAILVNFQWSSRS